MVIALARRDDVAIAYERLGPPGGEPLLLIMGLGMQLLSWPDELCAELTGRGYSVVRFDNRDAGESTHWSQAGSPSLFDLLARPRAVAPYRLTDMALDAVAVLDAVGWPSAHVAGASLGGMIAQTLAIGHPDRVRTLTSIMSTPTPQIGRARLGALRALGIPPATTRDEAGERMLQVFTAIGSPAYPRDEAWLRDVGRRAYDRGHDPAGARRQLAAIRASGDRRPGLATVRVPTLVVHGDADPLIRVAGGRATAAAVPGARLVVHPGMGHDLPRPLWTPILDEIGALTAA
ncbi:alpha/beta fold hydrolase [Dactylosporangium sp. NPDC049742]|uniref:alpha/beta fold hydrolase n=1 Tax=Dactylosporangium sp. NPDC049742 TaxID=3154737 RepID=UPI003437EF80